MIVVPVLITNCQVWENLKIGPLAAQTMTISTQIRKAGGLPVILAVALANLAKSLSMGAPSRHTTRWMGIGSSARSASLPAPAR